MSTFLEIIGLISTFYILAIICDKYFVPALEVIADKLKMTSEMAGATLMAVGSSAPELFTSLFAIFRVSEESNLGAGTIVGSAIFNVLVIVGASALYMTNKQKLAWQPVIRDMLFYCAAILLLLASFTDGKITLSETIIFIVAYLVYLFAVKNWGKWFNYQGTEIDGTFEEEEGNDSFLTKFFDSIFSFFIRNPRKNYIYTFIISICLIAFFSHWMVEFAVGVAHAFHIPAAIIGLTILAAGTSVPDLISSIVVAKKGRADMAVSNAVGSNIFDIFIGLGLVYFISLTFVNKDVDVVPIDTNNLISSIILLFATVVALIFLLIFQKWRLGKYSGYFLILLYLIYLGYNVFVVYVSAENENNKYNLIENTFYDYHKMIEKGYCKKAYNKYVVKSDDRYNKFMYDCEFERKNNQVIDINIDYKDYKSDYKVVVEYIDKSNIPDRQSKEYNICANDCKINQLVEKYFSCLKAKDCISKSPLIYREVKLMETWVFDKGSWKINY